MCGDSMVLGAAAEGGGDAAVFLTTAPLAEALYSYFEGRVNQWWMSQY